MRLRLRLQLDLRGHLRSGNRGSRDGDALHWQLYRPVLPLRVWLLPESRLRPVRLTTLQTIAAHASLTWHRGS